MARLYGREWTRGELEARVGAIAQLAGVRASRLDGGRSTSVKALDFDCGDGLRFTVLPDLCMDIPRLEYRGVPLTWFSRNGIVAPQYYDPQGIEWMRSFFGGLLTTCGLRQVGSPCVDNGEALGQHGRIANVPAEAVSAQADWEGDAYVLRASGTMRETRVFGEDLRLTRTITARLGERALHIQDRVENLGSEPSPFMILYHMNAGFPLLSETTRLLISDAHVEPRDDRAREGLADITRFGPPQRGFSEQVYWHDVRADANGYCSAAFVNEALDLSFGRGLGLAVRWRRDQLWNMVQWKQLGSGDYVAAIEPANCHTLGRCKERELGTLQQIAPGEVRHFDLDVSVLVGQDEIAAFEAALPV